MSYQSSIRALAQSIVDLCVAQEEEVTEERVIPLLDECEICGASFLADHPEDCSVSGLCDECAGRLTVEIPCVVRLDEPFDDAEWLDESDVIAA